MLQAYFLGGAVFGRTLDSALADPASTARIVQSNNNLRAEMERTRSAINETRDALIDIKLELRYNNAHRFIDLIQQR